MIHRVRQLLARYYPWFFLLLGMDLFCVMILWVSDIDALRKLSALIFLTSFLLFILILVVMNRREMRNAALFQQFVSDPTPQNETRLLQAVSPQEGESIRLLATVLRQYKEAGSTMAGTLSDYEEYVEGWVHEAKTPLALLTMILDNRSDEMSPEIHTKLDYARGQLQEDITQILYYARLRASTKDYRFTQIDLLDCVEEVLEDYASLLEENEFVVCNKLQSESVFTDRRGLQFIFGQVISNALKYRGDSPMLTISFRETDEGGVLSIADNGAGVKEYDLPYIFQKGFTGDSTANRKKATGMGLYLAKEMADDLKLKLQATSTWGEGFTMEVIFPKISD